MSAKFNRKKPAIIFVALCLVAAVFLGAYLLHAQRRPAVPPSPAVVPSAEPGVQLAPEPEPAVAPPAVPPSPSAPAPSSAPAPTSAPAPQRLFFRHNGVDSHYGAVAWIDLANAAEVHFADTLQCEVVHVSGGQGICLSADRGVFTTYAASLFDTQTLAVTNRFPLKGIPSRARVSIDGSLAALTVFVSGHGYTTLDFSTQTLLIDTADGSVRADLESFDVRQAGALIKNADFNFWGVTFTPDAKQFYATLSTGGKHFLIHGDIAARTAEVVHENVECPSLSPDARRIAYKKRLVVDNRIFWQLHVLDLASDRETALAEKRSIDDQLEWLDDRHVLYSVPSADDGSSPSTDVWTASIDARNAPRLFLRGAYSPAAARCKIAAACARPR